MLAHNLRKPRLILFAIVFLLLAYLLWRTRSALTPFILGLVVAYLILPLVNRVQKLLPDQIKQRGVDRPLAIGIVYLLGLAMVVVATMTVIPPLVDQITSLYDSAPDLYRRGSQLVDEALVQYRELIPEPFQERIEEQIAQYDAGTLLDPLINGTLTAVGAIGNTLSFIIGLVVIPFWLFFILNDEGSVMRGALGMIPRDVRADAEAMRIIMDRVLGAYIRGQLLVASAIGVTVFIGLFLLQVPYSLLLGLVAGMLALIPFLGAILGALPAVIVAYLQSPQLALQVVVLFIVIQQIDNIFFSPRIMGDAVALHPAMIMVVIVIGSTLLGAPGALIAVPLAAILRDVVHYFYIRVGDEPVTAVDALTRVGYGDSITPVMKQEPIIPTMVASSAP